MIRELKIAARRLRKEPGTTLVVVSTLALCLGTATALFSVVESVLLDPWPYQGFDRIVTFRGHYPAFGESERRTWSVPELQDLREQTHVFDQVMTGRGRSVNLVDGGYPERVRGAELTASFFPMLGVAPEIGRTFTAEEDRPGAGGVVVMSHDLWQRRFGGDPSIVGKRLDLQGESHTVVGVMPHRFRWWGSDLWFPLGLDTSVTDRSDRRLTIQARLREGVDVERAEAELNALAARWAAEHGTTNPEYRGMTFELSYLAQGVLGEVRPALLALLGFVALLSLLGCLNVAGLLTAQALARRKEVAVQLALGAGRGQILRRLGTESLLRALLGGAAGLVLAVWAVKLIVALIPEVYIPAETEIDVDGWALLFSFGASVAAAFAFGLLPAWQAVNVSQSELLRARGGTEGGGARRVRSGLVVAEVALGTVVLIAAGLMIRTYDGLARVDPGFDPDGVIAFGVSLPEDRYGTPERVDGFFAELTERIGALPGVESVGATTTLPLAGGTGRAPVTLEGRSAEDVGAVPTARGRVVRPGYFQTLEIPVLEGRDFGRADAGDGLPVVIVNRRMAEAFWGGENPMGRRLRVGGEASERPYRTVVGVVGDVLDEGLDQGPVPVFYLPHGQRADTIRSLTVVVATGGAPEDLMGGVRAEAARLDPQLPIYQVRTLRSIWTESLGAKPLAAILLTLFAGIALLLAGVGLAATMAYAVSRRTGEIGIRMALGADRGQVARGFLASGLRLTALGVVLGLAAGALTSRAVEGLIYGVETVDPATFGIVAAAFALVGALGSWVPSRRASRLDPAIALRRD